ncbi:MAG TPA: D-erythronate dehydrogenase [Candidatus Acidoferrum sp.]|nr:D-erythronate dehydrogenase [Candidatus Acidoferrum sp.]
MKVVITGGAGFIGRQLAERLLALGELPGRDGKPQRIDELVLFDAVEAAPFKAPDKRLRTITGDIADYALVKRTIDPSTGSVFHLAAVVSAAAEADFDLGMRVNVEGTRAVLEACRALPQPARLVFTSSIAVFGGDMPPTLTDTTPLTPQTSYGAQKAIGELLLNDYSRKGFVDGRALRLPTIVVRPGKPNKAASTFASSILREPLAGQEAICPVERSARMWILSPRRAVESLLHAHALPAERWGTNRSLTLPGIEVSIGDMVDGLGRVAGKGPVARIKWQPDAHIQKIVAGWPYRFDPSRARTLGFSPDKTIDEIIQTHIDDQLGGKFAA